MNSTLHSATAEYIETVRDALADQPASEVEEVIDDITEHLEQVVAELGGDPARQDLEERLGTPRQYAEELRAAAGLSEPDAVARPRRRGMAGLRFIVTWAFRLGSAFAVVVGIAMWASGNPHPAYAAYFIGLAACLMAVASWLLARRSADLVDAVRELPDVRRIERGIAVLRARPWGSATIEFVESLRPAWWLLRGWMAAQALMVVLGQVPVFPIARTPLAVVVLVVAVVASVAWGRRAVHGMFRGWRRHWSGAGSVAIAVVTPVVLLLMSTTPVAVEHVPVPQEVPTHEGFFHPDGTEIINLYVYGRDGRLIEGARIYDQDGRPVENVAPWKSHECIEEGGWFAGGPQGNVFPRPGVYYNTQPPRCTEPGEAAPFGPALPGSVAEQPVAEAEVDRETDRDSDEAQTGETSSPGGRTPQPDAEVDPTVEPG